MNLIFQYDREKDIECIFNMGKSSRNSPYPTKIYAQIEERCGEKISHENISQFIDDYMLQKGITFDYYKTKYEEQWNIIADEFIDRAEKVFGVALQKDVIVYLTINDRCPYDIKNNYFFATVPMSSVNMVAMHELWHFYTWYGLGVEQQEMIGKEKYNELKEALTVLINIECGDLLPEGINDTGYLQHQVLRDRISNLWKEKKDIHRLWNLISA